MNNKRYRYVRYENKTISHFIDSPDECARQISLGAAQFSVHSYSSPLEHEARPKRIWGDLHLCFIFSTETFNSERLSSLLNLLTIHDIPNQSVAAYYINNGVEVIIDERTFRGEVGSPCRFDFDGAIQRLAQADSLSYLTINNVRVTMSQIPVATIKDPEALEQTRHPLFATCTHSKNTDVVTTLARTYYAHHYKLKGLQDYMVPKHAYTANCSIYNTLLKRSEASLNELAIIFDLFGGDDEYFKYLLDLHGRQNILINVPSIQLRKARAHLKSRMKCNNVEKALGRIDKAYTCHQKCGVSTPQAFPFTAGHDCPAGLIKEDSIFSLRPTGLYAFYPEQDRWFRIMDPIWVNRTMPDTQGGLGAREIICHDVDGFSKTLVINQKDFDSTTFFSILQNNRVHVPNDNRMKGQLRAFLAGQYPRQPRTDQTTMVDQSGWQNGFQYIPSGTQHSLSAPYKARNQALPITYDVRPSLKGLRKTQDSACRHLLLGALASMTAPTLALVKTPGICLHFHGRSQSARNALLASISKVAGHAIYSLPDALKHVVALKGHHKDSTLHIAEVEDDDIKGMHRFIRRYFLGRKGKDGPVAGIIISTGNSPLGQKGGHLFTHNKRVLAVDVELPEDHTATYTELQPLQDALIEALTVHRDETLSALKGKKEELLRAEPQAKDQVGKQVASIFWLCAAVGTWFQEQGKLSWWKGRTIQNLFNEIIVKYNQHECFISALHKLSLIMPTNAKIGEYKIKRPREMEEISRGEILIPTAEMREVVPPQHTLRQWTAWLLKNTILIPNKAGRLSATYYSKKQGKSIKGYLVNHRKLHKVLNRAQKNVAKSSYLVF